MTVLSAASQNAKAKSDRPPSFKKATADIAKDDLIAEVRERFNEDELDADDFGFIRDLSPVEDFNALSEAAAWWQRGDKREALHYLELALGRDFMGLGDLRPEDLR